MKEFLPWSNLVYQNALNKYINGQFSVLDIQLNGKCNFNCIYCDSPDRNMPSNIDFDHLEHLIIQNPGLYDWMFICGLGEPLWEENKKSLLCLLEICKRNKMKCTIFTNGSNLDETVLEYICNGTLFPIIKIDTFSNDLAESLYGTSLSKNNLTSIDTLFNIAKANCSDYYSIAASIVPTRKNLDEIPYIVERCLENNTFPLLGQLEYAGKAIGTYNDLLLSKDELLKLKTRIGEILGCTYKVPICPSVIAGIHINNSGYVSVDTKTGFSCSWFWLETPNTINLCDINTLSSLKNAEECIIDYRNKIKSSSLFELALHIEEQPFGGCGGNIKDLFNDYLKIQNGS